MVLKKTDECCTFIENRLFGRRHKDDRRKRSQMKGKN